MGGEIEHITIDIREQRAGRVAVTDVIKLVTYPRLLQWRSDIMEQ